MNRTVLITGVFCVMSAIPAIAQDAAATTKPAFDGLSTLWVLVAAMLVFFMQAGFGMVEAGLIRAKNAGNVLMKNVLDFSFASLGYFAFGYAIMWGS